MMEPDPDEEVGREGEIGGRWTEGWKERGRV